MNERPIDLRMWRQFLAVAQELHFGRAARSLHMTQPPLTQGIAQLESVLGVRLFERNKRSVRLSVGGAALLPQVRDLLSRAQALPAMARAAALPPVIPPGHGEADDAAVLAPFAAALRPVTCRPTPSGVAISMPASCCMRRGSRRPNRPACG